MIKSLGKNCIVIAFWLCLWALLAYLADRELLLPGPLAVLKRICALAVTGFFWKAVAASLARILLGSVCGILLGTVLAVLTCRFPLLNV